MVLNSVESSVGGKSSTMWYIVVPVTLVVSWASVCVGGMSTSSAGNRVMSTTLEGTSMMGTHPILPRTKTIPNIGEVAEGGVHQTHIFDEGLGICTHAVVFATAIKYTFHDCP